MSAEEQQRLFENTARNMQGTTKEVNYVIFQLLQSRPSLW